MERYEFSVRELIVGLDGQYIFISIIGIFALSVIISPGPIVKTLLASLLFTGLVLPITRQFLLPALPVITWAVLFYSARYIFYFRLLILVSFLRIGDRESLSVYFRPWKVYYTALIYPTSFRSIYRRSSMFWHGYHTA